MVTLGSASYQTASYVGFKREEGRSIVESYLDESLVFFLDSLSQKEALDTLIAALAKRGKLKDEKRFKKAIFDREKIVSTGVGFGVAIPHAKLKEYPDFFIAIGIVKGEGLDWNALDGKPVNLIFLIGGPDHRQTQYLKILSELTSAIQNEEKRSLLLQAESAKEIVDLCSRRFAWI